MFDIEKFKKELLKRAKEIALSGVEYPEGKILVFFKKNTLTYCLADKFEQRQGINEVFPRIVAIKRLPAPGLGAWSNDIIEDSVTVARYNWGRWISIADKMQWDTEEEVISYYKDKEIGFYLLSREETVTAITEVQKYIKLDTDDFRGNVIGALYTVGCEENSPCPEWNEMARRINEEKKREYYANEWGYRMKEYQNKEEVINILAQEGIQAKIVCRADNCSSCWDIVTKEGKTLWCSYEDKDKLLRKIKEYKKEIEDYQEYLERKRNILDGKIPIFSIGNFKVFANGDFSIPKNIIPHFIGKGGRNIKDMEEIIGRKIKIKEVDNIIIGRKDKVCIERPMSLPILDIFKQK